MDSRVPSLRLPLSSSTNQLAALTHVGHHHNDNDRVPVSSAHCGISNLCLCDGNFTIQVLRNGTDGKGCAVQCVGGWDEPIGEGVGSTRHDTGLGGVGRMSGQFNFSLSSHLVLSSTPPHSNIPTDDEEDEGFIRARAIYLAHPYPYQHSFQTRRRSCLPA